MENISVNALVDSYENHLPREIQLEIAKSILAESFGKTEALQEFAKKIDSFSLSRQKRVINCTGTLLHTNLGRAQSRMSFSGHATNVEYDLEKQERGIRNNYLTSSMNILLNSEDVCFVNNNASSLFLTLQALKKENKIEAVIISRGEIIEIGGSYRLPEIIQETGMKLVEVGTTNKTHPKDYKKALKENPNSLVLKVHRSNFSLSGFVKEVSIKELKTIADEFNVLLIHDLGSGLVIDRKFLEMQNISYFDKEMSVQESLKDGSDIVMFSGDKLFGSIQSGIIAGSEDIIRKIKKYPLFRTFRCSPVVTYELQKTTELYLSKEEKSIPFWLFLSTSRQELDERVQNVSKQISLEHSIIEDFSLIGGGSMPDVKISSSVISVNDKEYGEAQNMLSKLDIPIVPRTKDNNLIFDLRSSFVEDDTHIINALNNL
ncbi:L-seryl-tRNA(Sec) selenium transferase [Acidimicrobiia bacterium]|nr:L-seryl-tRNA(Sec) selenium transferase [Acidimicrobiia bacterium]